MFHLPPNRKFRKFWLNGKRPVFQGSLLVILLWPKPDVNIPNIFDRFHPWTSDFQISMRQKYWRFRLNFEIVKVRLSAVCKQSFLSHMPLTVCKTFAWQTFASLRLFTCLVYVSTYCVPIAHLRRNKPFPLLYLGHAQIISEGDEVSWGLSLSSGLIIIVKPLLSGSPIKRTPSIKRTLSQVPKWFSYVSRYNEPLLSGHLH